MHLEIKEITGRVSGGFDVPIGYQFQEHWQNMANRPYRGHSGYRQFKVIMGDRGEEVARFELDETAERRNFIGSTYPIPPTGPPILEIQYIDVLDVYRHRGIGRWIVRQLELEKPDVQLIALAEESEDFWKSLGWTQVLPDERGRRELYMSPDWQ